MNTSAPEAHGIVLIDAMKCRGLFGQWFSVVSLPPSPSVAVAYPTTVGEPLAAEISPFYPQVSLRTLEPPPNGYPTVDA